MSEGYTFLSLINGEKLFELKCEFILKMKQSIINSDSIIKLINDNIIKTYYLNDVIKGIPTCHIVESTNSGIVHTRVSQNEVFNIIFDDIFIRKMKLFGCDYINFTLDNEYEKKDYASFEQIYNPFISSIINNKFDIHPRTFLICAIISRLAYNDNIIPRYDLKKTIVNEYKLIKYNNSKHQGHVYYKPTKTSDFINNSNIFGVPIWDDDKRIYEYNNLQVDLITLIKWTDDESMQEHRLDFSNIIKDLRNILGIKKSKSNEIILSSSAPSSSYKTIKELSAKIKEDIYESDEIDENKDTKILDNNSATNIGQVRYYLLYDKHIDKFILSIRGTDVSTAISNWGINVQFLINSIRSHYKKNHNDETLNKLYLYLTNIISNVIIDTDVISEIFSKHIKLDLLVKTAETYITSSALPYYLKDKLIFKVKTLCETSKIINIMNGFLYSPSAYECLCKIYKIIISNDKIKEDEIIVMFDELLKLFCNYIVSIVDAINGMIKGINWIIMTVPKIQYIPLITSNYIVDIFSTECDNFNKSIDENINDSDDNAEKLNINPKETISKIILNILKNKLDKIMKKTGKILMMYINNKYLENSLKFSKNIVENCYELIRALDKDPKNDLIITGHSLGGGITQYLSACYSNLGITFNTVGTNIAISDLELKKPEIPIMNEIELKTKFIDGLITKYMNIKLENKYETQIVEFVPKQNDSLNITNDYILQTIVKLINPEFKLTSIPSKYNVINLVTTQDLIHKIKLSTSFDTIHIGKLYVISEISESSHSHILRESFVQYMMSYNYKTCIESDDDNYVDSEYVNLSVLIKELYNCTENISTFHSIDNMLLYLIRIFNKIDPTILNISPKINKKIICEPLFLPTFHGITKMYKCTDFNI